MNTRVEVLSRDQFSPIQKANIVVSWYRFIQNRQLPMFYFSLRLTQYDLIVTLSGPQFTHCLVGWVLITQSAVLWDYVAQSSLAEMISAIA